ncbi:MAG: LuxR C-terminal-related transcriptional regulator [Candidatus Eremiobacteraeota bacterium]|nr:LuxR C-terminal-related transcriptional regulator [Candidatus Eremiobacteraeota bacterium]
MNRTRLTRPRITARIARAAQYPVTAIFGAAGFGKSVALSDYLTTERVDHVRYDVRTDHTSLFEFVRAFAKALEGRMPQALASFASAQERAMAGPDPVRDLSRWMLEHLRGPLTVVIDDLHNAAPDSRSVAFLRDLIEMSDENIRWMIASRSPLDLPAGSWMAYEKMDAPIDEDDLRFTVDEALAAAQDGIVDEEMAQELLRLTDGWPVAFSIGMRGSTRISELEKLTHGTREMIYRYLAEQVFERLSAEKKNVLLGTCVYPSLDLAIVERRGDSSELLAELRREAGFIYAASEKEYRYHDLFREFLESELRAQGDTVYNGCLTVAAQTLEELNRPAEALSLKCKAHEIGGILELISRSGFDLVDRGRTDIVESCLGDVPDEHRAGNAIVLGMEAVLASRRGQTEIAEQRYLLSIELAENHKTRAELVYRYAIDLVRAGREEAIALLEPYANDDSLDVSLRASILATLATAHTRAQYGPAAKRFIEQALTLLERSPNAVLRAKIYQQAAYVMFFTGDPKRAAQYATSAIDLATAEGAYEIAARAYTVLHNISHDVDDDPIASLRYLESLEVCARKSGSRQMQLFALLGVYDIESQRGNEAALHRLDGEIEALEMTLPESVVETLLPARALRAAWRNDFAEAYRLLKDSAPAHAERRALRCAEIAVYALASNARAEGDEFMLASYAVLKDSTGTSPRVLRTSLFLAIAELLRGKEIAAHRLIEEVEGAAEPSMVRLRMFARAVRAVYNSSRDPESKPALAAALERLRAQEMGGVSSLLSSLPFPHGQSGGLSTLTTAERAILRALAAGASSKQIALESGRSPQTIDVHIRSICRKLGCRGRIEAIALALSSGFLHSKA